MQSANQKLIEVSQVLESAAADYDLPYKSAHADYLSTSKIATKLFARLVPKHLKKKTSSDLVHITKNVLQLVQLNLENRREHYIKHETFERYSSFYVSQGDKPFIINSITELFRELSISVRFLLHPIYMHDGFRLSVIYLECEKQSPDQMLLIEKQINEMLIDLRHATDDYTSMLVKAETLAKVLTQTKQKTPSPHTEQLEVAEFLRWLTDGGYIFLGHSEWRVEENMVSQTPSALLGLFHPESRQHNAICSEAWSDANNLLNSEQLIYVSKLGIVSQLQRHNRLTCISILEHDSAGAPLNVHSLVGLFTSKALSQESSSIPLIRHKLKLVAQAEDLYENSFDYKNTVNIIDSMPKDEALRVSTEDLRAIINTILGIQSRSETNISIRFDNAERGVFALVILPRDRFNGKVRDELQSHLELTFGASPGSSEYHLDLSNKPFARLYFYVPIAKAAIPEFDIVKLEQEIAKISQTWINYLEEQLLNSTPDSANTKDILNRYLSAFPDDYQALCSVSDAVNDIAVLEKLYTSNQHFAFAYRQLPTSSEGQFSLLIYNLEQPITLSRALPVLENIGLEVITETCLEVLPLRQPKVFIHRYTVKPKLVESCTAADFESLLAPALAAIFLGEVENDLLNSLIISASLTHQQVTVLRAYCNLLWQVNTFATRESMYKCLATNTKLAGLLWHMFSERLDPACDLKTSERQTNFDALQTKFVNQLHKVNDISDDRILRALNSLVQHSIRTNYFSGTDTLAIKLHSEVIEIIPQPRPLFEIFVYSTNLQGTHLRMSKVARGGIRWSDRYEDYRSEVLGLVKTQKVKNAVIVPSGAKGGFVVRNLSSDPTELRTQVKDGYSRYIKAMLSLADNLIDGQPQPPTNLICLDQPDPYFVVAADKGTATFSDTANSIAIEHFGFWLNDAFASGGSQGYDHKLYGITAKGAWECVLRHFRDIGINYEQQDFSVIGIGDMSGDVFGNGMILSDRIKLLAAFNHKHIFIDPNPDAGKSYIERKRLFELPGSQWSDYEQNLVSTGGGIFNRFEKRITLTPEIKALLATDSNLPDTLNGEELIHLLLQAPCDLLWNGGIGTYVKSQQQSNSDVADSTNDRVRINACQLKARVVGEGGNLGFTQLARLEFAEAGGRINSDAIDNSAGVDLSDHEVNIKILLSQAENKKLLTRPERDVLLNDIAPEVVEHVLSHNRNHAMALTIGVHRSQRNIAYYRSLIRELHKLGYINRTLEYLPDDEDLMERAKNKQGLSRPELAICLAGVKMHLKDVIDNSNLALDPQVQPYLFDYFPKKLQENYPELIKTHPLAKNLIATQVTNNLVDTMGVTFVHRVCATNSLAPITIINAAVAAQLTLSSPDLLIQIEKFNNFSNSVTFLALRREINAAIRHITSWFLLHHNDATVAELVGLYSDSFEQLLVNITDNLSGDSSSIFKARYDNYIRHGLDTHLARKIAALVLVEEMLEIVWIARAANSNYQKVGVIFAFIQEYLGVGTVLKLATQISSTDKWDSELLMATLQDIKRAMSGIVKILVTQNVEDLKLLTEKLGSLAIVSDLKAIQSDLLDNTTVTGLAIYMKRLSNLKKLLNESA